MAKKTSKSLDQQIADKRAEARNYYRMSIDVSPEKNDLSRAGIANSRLSDEYYTKSQKADSEVKKLLSLKKSLGTIKDNVGMKKIKKSNNGRTISASVPQIKRNTALDKKVNKAVSGVANKVLDKKLSNTKAKRIKSK